MILSIDYLYYLVGAILLLTAGMTLADSAHPKRLTSALFWALYAVVFLVGDHIPPVWMGVGVVVMALIAGFGGVGHGKHHALPEKEARAQGRGSATSCSFPHWRSRWSPSSARW